jgi:seryl-tRNA synthetase
MKNLQLSHGDLEQFLKEKASKEAELILEVERLKEELESLDNERNALKSEMRKVKRK